MISIIVPVYNSEKTLERCVRSIMLQTYSNLEIILINDGSLDKSGEICNRLAEKDDRIIVIHTKNGGAARARNIGISIAKGEYLGFVDSDDFVEPQMYEILLNNLKIENTDISCVGMIRENQDGSHQKIIRCTKQKEIFEDSEIIYEILIGRYIGSSLCTKLYKKVCWNNLRLPEGEINEDTKVIFDLYKNKTMVHTGKSMYHYTINEKGVTHTLNYENLTTTYDNAIEFVKKAEQSYPKIKDGAIFYLADTVKVIMMQENVTPETDLYKNCKKILNRYYKILGKDWRVFLLRMDLYHRIKDIVKGK